MFSKLLPVLLLVSALAAAPAMAGHGAMTYDQALAKAAQAEKPVLLKIGTEWCSACKAFDKAVAENAEFKKVIVEKAVLVQLDGEKGEGVDVAYEYGVHGYPTFLLTNAEGEVLDRWMGFGETAEFQETLASATANPMTVDERVARFAQEPTEADALKIGDLRLAEGLYAEAHQYFRRAADLGGDSHAARLFRAVAWGSKKSVFTADEVREQADAVFASENASDEDLMQVLHTMRGIARHEGDMAYYTPYLEAGYERTSEADGWVAKTRSKVAAEYILHVEKNPEKAVETMKASLPEGWKDDAQQLNSFAWWCYENRVNLEQAEEMARRGVELAEPGQSKALVLDTLAELCNVNGDCGESLDLIRLAIAEDPGNDYYKRQEERFAELLAQESR